jgi:hypothetical protein
LRKALKDLLAWRKRFRHAQCWAGEIDAKQQEQLADLNKRGRAWPVPRF